MATVVPPGFSNVRFVFSCAGVTEPMGFSLGCSSITVGTPSAILDVMRDAFDATIWAAGAAVGNQWTWVQTDITMMGESGPVLASAPENQAGDLTAFNIPAQCCALITKQTALGGRRNRGRTYLPAGWLFENEVGADARITGSAAGALQTRFNNFRANVNLEDVQLYLFHSTSPLSPTEIIGFSASTLLGTQRRRIR